jgi:hypothetical protein
MTAISVRERLRSAGDDGPGWLAAIHVTAVLGTADAMTDDVAEAEAATERLAAAPPDDAGLAVRDIWLLRLRAFTRLPEGRTLRLEVTIMRLIVGMTGATGALLGIRGACHSAAARKAGVVI